MRDARCRIELLGWLRVEQGDRVVTRFRTYKTGALLAYLAFYLHRSHPREELIALLWPDSEMEAGRNSLSKSLSSLRQQLEPPGVPTGAVLIADRATLQLNPDAVSTDVAAFEAALRSAAQAGSEARRIAFLAEAVEVYRGELLPGFYEDWNLAERQRLNEACLQALGPLILHHEGRGEWGTALEYARRGVQTDPLREEMHQALIRLYMAAGQNASALRQYQELERLLKAELDAAPHPAIRQLVRQIRAQEEAEARPPEHRSLPAPERPVMVLPSGTVTFLLTDLESSTALSVRDPDAYLDALSQHNTLLRTMFHQHDGEEFKQTGDGFLVAFRRAGDALAAAIGGQRALAAADWPEKTGPLRVRMTLHTGDIEPKEGDFQGPALNRASRILSAGHGGQILCSETTATLLRRDLEPGVRLTDLGVYRLREVDLPERLFGVEYPQMPERSFPPLAAEPGYAGNLPLQLTRFFGREAEMERLLEMLGIEALGRLVTLTGPGGSGKTRLALEVAGRLAPPLQGAVWFVPLADLTDAQRIMDTVLDALKLSRSPNREPLEQIAEFLPRQTSLLLLDNFEHLVQSGTPILRTLLQRLPALKCLVTSRQLLGLSGEQEFAVLPLPVPEGVEALGVGRWAFRRWGVEEETEEGEREKGKGTRYKAQGESTTPTPQRPTPNALTPQRLMLFPSVQLFVDRAQSVRPDFQVTGGNAAAVAEICRRLEGIPLALELAAARSQVLTPGQMLLQLKSRFDFLTSRKRDVAERHRTLRAAIEWSYAQLSPELQRCFARLSVFRGGWTLEAAEQIYGHPTPYSLLPTPFLDLLEQLRECSLLLAEESSDGAIRFRMLETLREYAEEILTREEREALKQRHSAYFLAFAERAEEALRGAETAFWLSRLETEHDNLRAALETCLESRASTLESPPGTFESGEAGLRLAAALFWFWQIRGYLTEGRSWLGRALARPAMSTSASGHAVRARALMAAGNLAFRQSDYTKARVHLEESLNLAQAARNMPGIATALHHLGMVAQDRNETAAARAYYEESLAIQREIGETAGIAAPLHSLGILLHEQGEIAAARACCEESLAIRRALGQVAAVAASLNSLANILREQNDYAAARVLAEEALAIRRTLGDIQGIARSLNSLSNLASDQGDYSAARTLQEESLALFREVGDPWHSALVLYNLGNTVKNLGDRDTAHTLHTDSLKIWRELGDRVSILISLQALADLALEQGQPERTAWLWGALEMLRQGDEMPPPAGDRLPSERDIAGVRTALGEKIIAAEWARGRAMTLEQAVANALEESETSDIA